MRDENGTSLRSMRGIGTEPCRHSALPLPAPESRLGGRRQDKEAALHYRVLSIKETLDLSELKETKMANSNMD